MSEPTSFEVSTETLRTLSVRVGEASAAVAALRDDPSLLAAGLARAGSASLLAAAEAFGRSWRLGCAELEHQTSLLCDALRRAGDLYEVDEQSTVDLLRAARSSGYVKGLDGL